MKTYPFLFFALTLLGACTPHNASRTITILHTNDTHSQVEPKSDGTGGYARRMGYIALQRESDPDLILLDAGDFSQGSPYFNFRHGRVEVDALNRMGYDAVTLGNHEFDYGVDTLAAVLREARFPIVCANYHFDDTPLDGLIQPYVILQRGDLRIGVIGIGVKPDALIAKDNFAPIVWENPLPVVNHWARILRHDKKCDVVILLSHLGTEVSHGDKDGICDRWIAENSRDIDLIIGGHTHKVVEDLYVKNLEGRPILLRQTGKSGINIGKLVLTVR